MYIHTCTRHSCVHINVQNMLLMSHSLLMWSSTAQLAQGTPLLLGYLCDNMGLVQQFSATLSSFFQGCGRSYVLYVSTVFGTVSSLHPTLLYLYMYTCTCHHVLLLQCLECYDGGNAMAPLLVPCQLSTGGG